MKRNFFFFVFSLTFLFTFLFIPSVFSQSLDNESRGKAPQKVSKIISGTIINKTTNNPTKVETLALLQPTAGMKQIAILKNIGPKFQFEVSGSEGPLLVQAIFDGVKYNQLITVPQQDLPQEINVYHAGASFGSLDLTVALNVSKRLLAPTTFFLHVKKFYAFSNESLPPRSFDLQKQKIYVPPNAKKIAAFLSYSTTQMPVPTSLHRNEDKTYSVKAHIRPGEALLELSYEIPGFMLEDRHAMMHPKTPYRVMTYSPPDAMPIIKNAKYERIDIPNVGIGYKVYSPSFTNDIKKDVAGIEKAAFVAYDFSKGSVEIVNPLSSHFATPFASNVATFLAFLFIFVFALYIIFIINKSKKKEYEKISNNS